MTTKATVFLIPTYLDESALDALPVYITDTIKKCTVFYVENERTARRYFKKLYKEMVIDDMEWIPIHKAEANVCRQFEQHLNAGKNIGIVSEAGCPGIADPGQLLIKLAQEKNALVKPLVGPSSVLLALMGSGFNGQEFSFHGYLPIEHTERVQKIKALENLVQKTKSTQIFMETPYRNNALLETILKTCNPSTLLCIAASITGQQEFIHTKTITGWKSAIPDLHKKPTIFLLGQ